LLEEVKMDFSPAAKMLGFDFGRTGIPSADPANPGLGKVLRSQVEDEIEKERKRRALGLSPLPSAGSSGVSPALRALGLGSVGMFGGGMK
jgi:hypothetical protein